MNEDTAPHDVLVDDHVADLLSSARSWNIATGVMVLIAVVIAGVLLGRAWPPPALQTDAPQHGSIDRSGPVIAGAWHETARQ